ncbi:MAG: hypothetical protein ACO3JL_15360 [Myxococcota bacterium]
MEHLVVVRLKIRVPALEDRGVAPKHVHQHLRVGEDAHAASEDVLPEAVEGLKQRAGFFLQYVPLCLTSIEKTAVELEQLEVLRWVVERGDASTLSEGGSP